jgi:ABC-2 type transport system ATP-binding protein
MTRVIQTERLTRFFGARPAVVDLSFAVEQGRICTLLGRNGAGKTTTLRMLLGLLEPTRGAARLFGEDSARLRPQTRARVGYLAEGHPVRPGVRVARLRALQARGFPGWNDELFRAMVDHFDIDPECRVSALSRGQRAGLSLALAMAPEPELLVLDDPTAGLDRVAHRALLEALVHFASHGSRTILLATHELHDVERVSDQLVIIDRGTVRACCSPETFVTRVRAYTLSFEAGAPDLRPEIPGLLDASTSGRSLRLVVANPNEETRERIRALAPGAIKESALSLEDAITAYLARGRNGRLRESPTDLSFG